MMINILNEIHKNLNDYIVYNKLPPLTENKVESWVLDIEACPTDTTNSEVLVYSIAIMDCYNNNICYKYNNLNKVVKDLMSIKKEVKIYIHNLSYDIKSIIMEYFRIYGNNKITIKTKKCSELNKFKMCKNSYLKENSKQVSPKEGEYSYIINNNQFYRFNFGKFIECRDTLKILPFSLQKCCKDFLNLDLPKEDLDYNKIRKADDELTKEELIYIYNDVFGLSQLVRNFVLEGFNIDGKIIKMDTLTTSSLALKNYKETLFEDFNNIDNAFKNECFYHYVIDNISPNFYEPKTDEYTKKKHIFRSIYPSLSVAEFKYIKPSYYGGLCCVDFDNVEKFKDDTDRNGVVLDVNSLYPSMMISKLLPYGRGHISCKPYKCLNDNMKKTYPLYFQEIIIHDFKVKKGKMHWVQVKSNNNFNGREVLKENINKHGKKQSIHLTLSNVLLDLLFKCYDVKSYELRGCICYRGSYDLYKNYISYWSEIKKNNKGAIRQLSKLMLNSLYGKMGANIKTEETAIINKNDIFSIKHNLNTENLYRDGVYLPMASFITSYAKEFLVNAINSNRQYFMYCDTDSIHLKCTIDKVKGVTIHDKNFSCWDYEMDFTDYRYIGPKRYAEKDKITGKWIYKCCGLSEKILDKIDDIDIFIESEITKKEIKGLVYYTNPNEEKDVKVYLDKDCSIPIKGIIRNKKFKIVKNGSIAIDGIYIIKNTNFY